MLVMVTVFLDEIESNFVLCTGILILSHAILEVFSGVFEKYEIIAVAGSIYEKFSLEAGIVHEAR